MDRAEEQKTVVIAAGVDRREMVRSALTMLGDALQEKIHHARRIFVHPNLVSNSKQAASTHVEAVRGVVDHISLVRNDEILVGDAAFHNTKKAFDAFDYASLSRSGNVTLVDLNDDETIESFAYTADMKKRSLPFSKTVAEADLNIVVVPPKMHSYYIASLSIKTHIVGSEVVKKSPFGIHARWPWLHTGYKPAHQTLADVYGEHPAQLAVIDGTMAMEGEGPASGNSVNLGWVLASFNPVAADALAAYLMGLNPEDIGYLFHLDHKGFGPIEVTKVHIVGADPQALKRELERPSSYPALAQWR